MADTTLDFIGRGYDYPAPTGGRGTNGSPGNDGGPGSYGVNGAKGFPGFAAQITLSDVAGKLTINAWGSPGQDGGKGGQGGRGGDGGDGGTPNQVVIYIKGKPPPIEINTGNSMPGKKGAGGDPGGGNGNYGRGGDGKPGDDGGPSTVTIIRV